MRRRAALRTLAGAAFLPPADAAVRPIQLHVDLEVDPARERELLDNFHGTFRPAIAKQPGFLAVRLLKMRSAVAGSAPADMTWRLVIRFRTEDQRQAWVKTDEHQRVWPEIEKTLKGAKLNALLYDET
jgi:heme-degrading monooxygenase HmoA